MVGARKPASGIAQSVYPVAQARKARLLTTLLQREAMTSVLVFVKRKSDADQLARTVSRSGVRATSIHSDRRQEDRVAALEAFRRGEYPVLVATDVAARGLDVEGISHIVNFDAPFSSDDYIHRAGRTAAPAPLATSSPSYRQRRRSGSAPSRRGSARRSRAWCYRTSIMARTGMFRCRWAPLRGRDARGAVAAPAVRGEGARSTALLAVGRRPPQTTARR
jgi:superfamily II DNA/RNA helicase